MKNTTTNSFKNIAYKISIFIVKVYVASLILMGLGGFLRLYKNEGEYIWQLILFSFVVGTFILSIQPKYLIKGQEKNIPTIGFLIIFSGVIILISYGLGFISPQGAMKLDDIKNLSSFVFLLGIFLFCYGLSDLTFELGRNIFPKK